MAVEIVTDSLGDITPEFAKELGITTVPVYVRFGEQVFKDRIEISTDEFYRRLVQGDVFPTTTQPTPEDFLTVYRKLAQKTNEILVVTLSSKLSGTYNSAVQAKNLFDGKCRIEVIDSLKVIMGLGVIIIKVAEAAKKGSRMEELIDMVHKAIPRSHSVMFFDTLKYLAKGGRIGKAQSLLGSLLAVKPVLTLKDGEVSPLTRVRSRAAGMDYLYNFTEGFKGRIDLLAVEYATTPDEAEKLVERLNSIYPKDKIIRATVSPVIGTYVGPHVLSVTVLETAGK